jgi:hypothetical protein
MKKDRISKEEILKQLEQMTKAHNVDDRTKAAGSLLDSIVDEMVSPVKPTKGSSDLANRYKFAYKDVYDNLSEWKKQVIDDKKYNDRIYKEYIKDVISQAEQKQVE